MLVHHPKGGTISQPDQECLGGFSVVGVVSVAVLETQFAILETRQFEGFEFMHHFITVGSTRCQVFQFGFGQCYPPQQLRHSVRGYLPSRPVHIMPA